MAVAALVAAIDGGKGDTHGWRLTTWRENSGTSLPLRSATWYIPEITRLLSKFGHVVHRELDRAGLRLELTRALAATGVCLIYRVITPGRVGPSSLVFRGLPKHLLYPSSLIVTVATSLSVVSLGWPISVRSVS